MYFLLKRMGQRDEKAFGIDKSDVVIEHVPLVYQPIANVDLKRIFRESDTFRMQKH
jgi:KUP system potassium uptake protein